MFASLRLPELPANLEAQTVLPSGSPAHQAVLKYRRGVNLSNSLEAPPGQDWGAHYTVKDLDLIKSEGFDHVRIPVAWHHYSGPAPEYRLSLAIYARVDPLVSGGLQRGLNVIVNLHHFDAFTTSPESHSAKFYALWVQLSDHYRQSPKGLAFELLNEPKDAATTAVMNPLYAQAIRVIRKTNPERTIFLGPGRWNQVSQLPALRLPEEDRNLIVTVHCYEPFYFTHQGATWSGPDTRVTGIQFPGPPSEPLVPPPTLELRPHVRDWIANYNTVTGERNPSSSRLFREAVSLAKKWSQENDHPIHLGEFGCYTRADDASRARYYRACREALEEAGIGWALWDWKAGFRYWDEKAAKPMPGMREALFGKRLS